MIREAGLNPASLHFQETKPIAELVAIAVAVPIPITTAFTILVAVVAITVAVVAKIQVIATLVAIIAIPVTVIAILVAIAVLVAVIAALFAGFVGFVPFMAPAIGLTAVIAVVLDGFAQLMLRVLNAALATIRFRARRSREESETTQRGGRQCCPAEHCLTKRGLPQIRMQSHTSSWAPPWCWLGFVCVLAYGTLRHEKCRWCARKKVGRLCVANTTDGIQAEKKLFLANSQAMRTRRWRDLFLKDSQTRELNNLRSRTEAGKKEAGL